MSDSVVLDSNGVTLKVVDTITSVSDFSNNNGSSWMLVSMAKHTPS